MDRQYKYFSAGVSHHHGFVSYSTSEYVDPVAKKRIELDRGFRIAPARR
jgi:hypothetical protein